MESTGPIHDAVAEEAILKMTESGEVEPDEEEEKSDEGKGA